MNEPEREARGDAGTPKNKRKWKNRLHTTQPFRILIQTRTDIRRLQTRSSSPMVRESPRPSALTPTSRPPARGRVEASNTFPPILQALPADQRHRRYRPGCNEPRLQP
jgi:hypothetical protein